ncbi:hypothetical protein HY218_00965, partial [Candidatus Saccharibacteria bacterium]|nr:hypothetical protein [Candidatus Saccharibacteria bacterium]
MSHRDHQAGFSALWALLIVVVLVAIGLSGWWVWRDKHKTSSTSPLTTTTTTIKSKTQTPKTMVEPDPTTSWTPYSSKAGKFSLKYPPTWVQAASPDLCAAGLVLLGPTKDS